MLLYANSKWLLVTDDLLEGLSILFAQLAIDH
jgi:hypothetical protein